MARLLYFWSVSVLAALLASYFVTSAHADDLAYPVCEMSDSTLLFASGLDDIMHTFGSPGYVHEFNVDSIYPVFNNVFDLRLSDGVSDRWSQSDW